MKRGVVLFLIGFLFCAVNCNKSNPSDSTEENGKTTTPIETRWNKHPDNPVLSKGPEEWDSDGMWVGSVLYLNGMYHMWYDGAHGIHGALPPHSIGYASSSDGIHWTKYGNNPVMTIGSEGSWDAQNISDPCVIFDGGIYHMWYVGTDDVWDWNAVWIGHATSADGIQWTRDPQNPVNLPNIKNPDEVTWVYRGVFNPAVVKSGDTYLMWYCGIYGQEELALGLATSPDGQVWTEHPDNPVMRGTDSGWDHFLSDPNVIYRNGTYHMWYHGASREEEWWNVGDVGYASSPDGISWDRYSGNPVIVRGERSTWEDTDISPPCVCFDGTRYLGWYTGETLSWQGNVGYLSSDPLE